MSKVIVIEDSSFFSGFVCKILNKENIETVTASNLVAAKKLIEKADQTDIVLADLRLPDGNSTDLLEWMNKQGYHQPFIMMTEHAEVLNTVLSFRLGSVDYIPKKLITDRLLDSVTEQMEKMGRLRQQEGQMICQRESPAFKQLYREIEMFARSNIRVMIMGESGTGKEHIAEMIHRKSKQADKPYVKVNCGGFTDELAPSEFFGHVKGAFTGAESNRKGYFEMADGGTLFLDEVGNLSMRTQQMLLRVLQEEVYRPVGSDEEKRINVRVISATNEDVTDAIAQKRMRMDFFYRLGEHTIKIPPLRECKDDVMLMAEFFLAEFNKENEANIKGFSDEAREKLVGYDWPGNVRELMAVVRNAAVMCYDDLIGVEQLHFKTQMQDELQIGEPRKLYDEDYERKIIEQTIQETGGNVKEAANKLGIGRTTIYNKMKKYGIK